MTKRWTAAIVGLALLGSAGAALAQYGGPDYGYRERSRGYDERPRYRDRDGGGFNEREYLRCNPDVRRAVNRGDVESGFAHYRTFGRRERRNLSC